MDIVETIDAAGNFLAIVDISGTLAFTQPREITNRCGIFMQQGEQRLVCFHPMRQSRGGETRWWVMNLDTFDALIERGFMLEMDKYFAHIARDVDLLTTYAMPRAASKKSRAAFKKWIVDNDYDYKIALANFCFESEHIKSIIPAISDKKMKNFPPDIITNYRAISTVHGEYMLARFLRTITACVFIRIIPLHIAEVKSYGDISMRTWREMHINRQVTTFKKRRIAFQFAEYSQPTIIDESCPALFASPDILGMFAGYDMSDRAIAFIGALRAASITSLSLLSDIDAKIVVFDWLYALYILAYATSAMHCNIMVPHLRCYHDKRHTVAIRGRRFQFARGGDTNVVGAVIDFSSCAVDPYAPNVRYASAKSADIFAREQASILMSFLQFAFADDKSLQEVAREALSSNFSGCFRALSLLDAIILARTIPSMTNSAPIREFAQKLEQTCEKSMRACVVRASKGDNIERWPLEEVLLECFETEAAEGEYGPQVVSEAPNQQHTRAIKREFSL